MRGFGCALFDSRSQCMYCFLCSQCSHSRIVHGRNDKDVTGLSMGLSMPKLWDY